MAVARSVKVDLGEPEQEKELSLMEKWRRHVEEKKKSGHEAKVGRALATTVLAFQVPSQLYLFMYYIIPYLFMDFDPWFQYYLKVFIVVTSLEFLANFLCVQLYDTKYRISKDNPQPREIHDRWNNPPEKFVPLQLYNNGVSNGDLRDKHGGLPWSHCDICKMDIPPRAHHCNFCKACILKRDHHCFFVGTCIGFRNQRYFVIMAFYTFINGLGGGIFTLKYLSDIYWPSASWTDFVLPITVYRTLFDNIPLHIGIMIYHCYAEFLFGSVGLFYFLSQMLIIGQGKTLYELAHEIPVKSLNSVNANFVSVLVNMAVARSVTVDVQSTAEEEEPKSLMEKFRKHIEEKKKKGHHGKYGMYYCWALWVFQTPTQLYMAYYYVIPYLLHDFTDWTQYYVKVIYTICAIQTLGNLVCTTLYSTKYEKSRDKPDVQGIRERWENPPDQFLPLNGTPNGHLPDDGGLPWTYCDECDMMKPPRAHHCKCCRACILKRDHHCFVVGKCIGHYNQRYFVVLTFYATIVGWAGIISTFAYLHMFYWSDSVWTDYVFPVTIFRGVFGTIPPHITIMIIHMYTASFIGILGFFYFSSQLTIVSKGITLYELAKQVPIRNTNSVNANFVTVFGNFWFLNFFFPMTILFPVKEDGTYWKGVKLDHNGNYKES
ncbi:uncharacterized protein LOC134235814 [Saccostrea cucullata]|uniref:uncharacterized protein LOC134235814 n=1 Tax=Saccostrea cuccullata TaxID=36930 RepID=UPI002ED0DE93